MRGPATAYKGPKNAIEAALPTMNMDCPSVVTWVPDPNFSSTLNMGQLGSPLSTRLRSYRNSTETYEVDVMVTKTCNRQ